MLWVTFGVTSWFFGAGCAITFWDVRLLLQPPEPSLVGLSPQHPLDSPLENPATQTAVQLEVMGTQGLMMFKECYELRAQGEVEVVHAGLVIPTYTTWKEKGNISVEKKRKTDGKFTECWETLARVMMPFDCQNVFSSSKIRFGL
ncbi:hypothetical protein BTVI_31085 [Pitangus sulphuratus]|nr:hypothetical protein BTVI_31085 [Pitangus sulphuratus]